MVFTEGVEIHPPKHLPISEVSSTGATQNSSSGLHRKGLLQLSIFFLLRGLIICIQIRGHKCKQLRASHNAS